MFGTTKFNSRQLENRSETVLVELALLMQFSSTRVILFAVIYMITSSAFTIVGVF